MVGPATVVGAAVAGAGLVTNRDASRNINNLQAAGHAGSVTLAAGLAGTVAQALTRRPDIAVAAAALTTARKMFLRRWMLTPPRNC